MKHWLLILLFLILAPATVAMATVTYTADLVVSNNSSTAYDQMGVTHSTNITLLVDNGFITSSGLDTRVQNSGSDLPWTLATDRITFAVPVPANSQNTYQFVTGETAASAFQIVTGYGGYITTADNITEHGGNFTDTYSGWVDTTAGANKNIWDKPASYRGFVSSNVSGNISVQISSYATDNITTWTDLSSDVADYQRYGTRIAAYPTPQPIYSVAFPLRTTGSPTGDAVVRVRNSATDAILGSMGTIDVSTIAGTTENAEWYYFDNVTAPGVADIRISIEYAGGDAANTLQVGFVSNDSVGGAVLTGYTAAAWGDSAASDTTMGLALLQISATGVSSGDIDITNWSDSADIHISIDGVESDNTTTVAAPNTTSNWTFARNNVTPYINSINMSVGGNQVLLYQPVNIIQGTTLPDTAIDATNSSGVITWGSNPTGVSTNTSALVSTQTITANVTSSTYIGNFMPDNVTAPVSPTLLQAQTAVSNDWLYPFIAPFAAAANLQGVFFYWFGTIICAIAFFLVAYRTKHLLIAAIAFDIPFGYGIAKDFIPEWVILALVIWTIGAAVQEARM